MFKQANDSNHTAKVMLFPDLTELIRYYFGGLDKKV